MKIMKRLKRFFKWYFEQQALFYAEAMKQGINPFLI
jgi:hypothetical protein